MAILYGTQSNGETLPVLVDQFGNLLAKGIDGAPGTPGTPGTPGPPGPPGADGGSFPLPPDPYEGALLGWLNDELAWIGTPPVPIPEGIFGPITNWDPGGLLTVAGEIPSEIAQGVFVYQCNEDGSIFVNGWNNSQVWSDDIEPTSALVDGSIKAVYDGDLTTYATFEANTEIILLKDENITANTLRINSDQGRGTSTLFKVNGMTFTPTPAPSGSYQWMTLTGWTGPIRSFSVTEVGALHNIRAIQVGELLVDKGDYPTAPNLNFRVQSVNGQNLIGVANRTDNFTIGKYLRVPQQNVARWLYDGNLNKVITSTGIDISRLGEI